MQLFEYTGPVQNFLPGNPFTLIPSVWLGLALWIFASVAVAILILRQAEPALSKFSLATLFWPSLIFIGVYTNTYGAIDEVMINLEHPYNLFHHGFFSMSPSQMQGGTVEMIYYLLHLPFAVSIPVLILGNYLIGLFFGWLHLVCAWFFWFKTLSRKNTLLLSCLAMMFPLVMIFSNGFGNVLLSLVFFLAISLAVAEKKEFSSLVVSGCLPLIRPEGLLLSLTHSVVLLFGRIRRRESIRFVDVAVAFIFPAAALCLYFSIYKIMYGVWIPTPLLFKLIKPVMLNMFSFREFVSSLFFWLNQPMMILGFAAATFLIFFWKDERIHPSTKTVFIYTLLLSTHWLFFTVSFSIVGKFLFNRECRYWVAFLAALALLTLLVVSHADAEGIAHPSKKDFPRASFTLFLFLFFTGLFFYEKDVLLFSRTEWVNRSCALKSGSFLDRLAPKDFRFSTTEMNSFGFGSDRFVIDLWGYSTREIAESKFCNGDKGRSNPDYFLSQSPEVYWPFWMTVAGIRAEDGFDVAEKKLLFHHLSRNQGNLLGDMREVTKRYDLFFVRDPNLKNSRDSYQIGFFIRRDVSERFRRTLKEDGFEEKRTRPLDPAWLALYESEKIVRYAC